MPREMTGIKFYTIKETAEELGVTQQTIRNYIQQGRLTGRRVGKFVWIPERDIKRLLKF